MRCQSKPRHRPMRDRGTTTTPGKFYVLGYPAGDGDNLYLRRVSVTWQDGTLSNAAMIAAAHERAVTLRADLSEPLPALALLLALYLPMS